MSVLPLRFSRTRRSCLLLASQRDPQAFADFYDAYAERVLRFLARRTLDAEIAIDLAAETFALALERRAQFRGSTPEEEQGWLFAIARSELSRYWRRGSVERGALMRIGIATPMLSEQDFDRIEELMTLETLAPRLGAALDALSDDQRVAVELRVVGELSYVELATRLGVSEQVARARVSRGLRALGQRMSAAEALLEGAA